MSTGNELVQVAFAADPVQAGVIQGLLEDRGISSVLEATSPSGTILVEPLLPESPQRVMVSADAAVDARIVLAEVLEVDEQTTAGWQRFGHGLLGALVKATVVSFGAMALVYCVFLLLR
jgi:hypothetical protein